jgi:hypothetical protein
MMKIHMDNCRGYDPSKTWQQMPNMKIKRLVHPLYLLDPSLCDFWIFGLTKTALWDKRFANGDALVEGPANVCDSLAFEELQSVFQNWTDRL